jgi:HD domain
VTVPDRPTAAALLLETEPPAWLVRHACAVAEVGAWLAARVAAGGTAVDRHLVEAAALLHDVDKAVAPDHPFRALPHGQGSAAWLAERGCAELGPSVADHPVTRLEDGDRFWEWLAGSSLETRIVAYADKRAGARLESMDDRFASWRRRYPGGWDETTARLVRERAVRLERAVCDAAGVEPGDVRRLRWTGPAIRAARVARPAGSAR